MKKLTALLPLLAICSGHLLAEPAASFHREPSPAACKVSADLFWIADTRKMDAFLANVDMPAVRAGAYECEVLPDTRVVWRDYAREARALAARGRDTDASSRIAQMLKLAAVYRSFGGLQNVVQGEEIRFLAGQTVAEIGCSCGAIPSPYIEKSGAEAISVIERKIGAEKNGVTASFWKHLRENTQTSQARLAGNRTTVIAATP